MSLFDAYQEALNSLAKERQYRDQINYQNYQQSESNRQGQLKGLTNAAIGAALMYAFPPAGMAAGAGSAALGAGLGYMGGGNAMAIPYMINKGGTPTPDSVSSGGGSVNPTGGYDDIIKKNNVSPNLSIPRPLNYDDTGLYVNQFRKIKWR